MSLHRVIVALFIFFSFTSVGHAHKASDAYLTVAIEDGQVEGQLSLHLRDIARVIPIDRNQNGEISWGEVKENFLFIAAYANQHLAITSAANDCTLTFDSLLIDTLSDGNYAVLPFHTDCQAQSSIVIVYSLFFDSDRQHRGILHFQSPALTRNHLFSPDEPSLFINMSSTNGYSSIQELGTFLKSGIWHIWIGFDHILFLLTLLLPAAFLRRRDSWQLQKTFAPVMKDIVIIVTSFTLAHSVTLSLVALGLINISPAIIEPLIALSVVAAAVHNIFPLWHGRRWMLAFAFGLIHGFGFAGILKEAGIDPGSILTPLVGFNIGVEIGQLAIVLAVLPFIYYGSRLILYRPMILKGGSCSAALIGIAWFIERVSG